MEHAGYPLYFPPSEMSFYWRRLPRGGDASNSTTLSLSLCLPFFVTPLPLSVSLFLFPNDFKVVAGNRFANPWRRRIGAFRTLAPRFHFAHNSTSTLSLFPPLVIYNRFSPFFAPTIQKSRLPCKLVPSLLLSYIIIHGDSCAHPAKK